MQAYQAKFLLFLRKIGVFAQTVVSSKPKKKEKPHLHKTRQPKENRISFEKK